MSIEKLLKPRYKVIADYPLSPYKIGDIITKPDIKESVHLLTVPNRDDFGDKLDEQHFYDIDDLQLYPALFQPLKWWEERKPGEMPAYISFMGTIYHITGWNYGDYLTGFIEYQEGDIIPKQITMNKDCYPATLTEYENYKQSKQCNS